MTTATDRGWGDPRDPNYRKTNIVPVKAGGVQVNVHKDIAFLVEGFLSEITSKGYRLEGVADDWGYCLRANRNNPKVLSNHSWGLALDLNATKNPNTHDGRVHTDMPAWVVEAGHRWGFEWGGNYHGATKDPMHYEVLMSHAACVQKVADLRKFFAGLKKAA